KRPQSAAAHLALADMFSTLAKNMSRTNNPSGEQVALYRSYVKKAFDELQACDSRACRDDPEWHHQTVQLLCNSQAPREMFGTAFSAAYAKFPDYLPIHRAGACYVLGTSNDPHEYVAFAHQLGAKAP